MIKKLLLISIIILFANSITEYKLEHRVNKIKLSENNIEFCLTMLRVKYTDVVIAQLMNESGNLKSGLCRKNNNLFGMTVPHKRKTTAINKIGYAKYNNWIESIIDYKYYQDFIFKHHKIKTRKDYITCICKNYAQSENYEKMIRESI